MSENFKLKHLILFLIFASFLLLNGCGGGGSDNNIDPASLVATLATGKLSVEGGETKDILFASVGGNGVTGGWIEDVNGNKLAGSDLIYENISSRYEVILQRPLNGFPAGSYILKYFVNGEAFEFRRDGLDWVNASQFLPAPPPPSWDPTTRLLTVRYQPVNGSSVRYFLRIYSAITGTLYRETVPTNGLVITENIPLGDYRVVLNAEVFENGQVVSTARHYFTTTISASMKVP